MGETTTLDAQNNPAATDQEPPAILEPNTLVEVDDEFTHNYYARIRIPVPHTRGVYFVISEVFRENLADLRDPYAERRITEIRDRQEAELLPDFAAGWRDRQVRLSWRLNPPAPLAVGQVVQVVGADAETATVRTGSGGDIALPLARFRLEDIDFERSAEEVAERGARLDQRKDLDLVPLKEVLALLGAVEVIKPYSIDPPAIQLACAASDETFDQSCLGYLHRTTQFRATPQQAARLVPLVNAFTDRKEQQIEILLRPGAKGAGTETHESLHALSSPDFDLRSSWFLREGVTEFFTRLAVGNRFNREDLYFAEHAFVRELVESGATDETILAKLYFEGDWAGFHKGLRDYTDLVSIEVFLARATVDPDAAIAYLRELHDDPEALVRSHQASLTRA